MCQMPSLHGVQTNCGHLTTKLTLKKKKKLTNKSANSETLPCPINYSKSYTGDSSYRWFLKEASGLSREITLFFKVRGLSIKGL